MSKLKNIFLNVLGIYRLVKGGRLLVLKGSKL